MRNEETTLSHFCLTQRKDIVTTSHVAAMLWREADDDSFWRERCEVTRGCQSATWKASTTCADHSFTVAVAVAIAIAVDHDASAAIAIGNQIIAAPHR